MEIINELIQVARQVVAMLVVVVAATSAAAAPPAPAVLAAIQVATQIITIEPIEIAKNVRCATVQNRHKDFIRCLIVSILHAVHVWKVI